MLLHKDLWEILLPILLALTLGTVYTSIFTLSKKALQCVTSRVGLAGVIN